MIFLQNFLIGESMMKNIDKNYKEMENKVIYIN